MASSPSSSTHQLRDLGRVRRSSVAIEVKVPPLVVVVRFRRNDPAEPQAGAWHTDGPRHVSCLLWLLPAWRLIYKQKYLFAEDVPPPSPKLLLRLFS